MFSIQSPVVKSFSAKSLILMQVYNKGTRSGIFQEHSFHKRSLQLFLKSGTTPANNDLFKANNKNMRKRCKIYSKFIIKHKNYVIDVGLVFLEPRRQPEGSYERVCPPFRLSFHPSICPGVFSGLYHQFFLNFSMMLETYMKLCVTEFRQMIALQKL